MREPAPLTVLETHAGAGLYDLAGEAARRSGEALTGIERLLQARDPPATLRRLADAVREARAHHGPSVYPGSPLLAAAALRPGDRYIGWELRRDDHERLAAALARERRRAGCPTLEARLGDGYVQAPGVVGERRLIMIDPPFEAGDEAQRLAACVAALALRPGGRLALWAPLKDLDGFDRLMAGVETASGVTGAAVELRLRPLDDPLRLNGCAMILLNAPQGVDAAVESAAWLAGALGDAGAGARLQRWPAG